MAENFPRGRFVWYDLMSTDPAGSQKFYTAVIGWSTQAMTGMEPPYDMWVNGEAPLGGVVQLPQEAQDAGAPTHWVAYVATADVEATAQLATELGGKVMVPPTDIPEGGRFCVLQDPQGAFISAYSSTGEVGGNDGPRQIGEFSWHELITTDYEAAFTFYSELFGWQKGEAMDMGPAGIYQLYGRTEMPLGGMFNKSDDMPMPPSWLLYIRVADMDQAIAKVKEHGGQIANGPMEVPGGDHITQCIDPQGGAFALHHASKS